MSRKKILFYGVVILFVSGAIAWLLLPKEPAYNGRGISEWLKASRMQRAGVGRKLIRAPEFDIAMQHMGSNAIPYLLAEMEWKSPRWHDWLPALVRKKWLRTDPRLEEFNHREAARLGLYALGTEMLPVFFERIAVRDERILADVAADILENCDQHGYPFLTNALSHSNTYVRATAVSYLVKFDEHLRDMGPMMVRLLKDPAANVRRSAAPLLQTCEVPRETAVPMLVALLEDKDASVRAAACDGLKDYGADAENALPGLKKLTGDNNATVRDRAEKAIKLINLKVEEMRRNEGITSALERRVPRSVRRDE